MQYFESDVPRGDGLCSDKLCPCPEVSIPRGTGYLYIEQDLVDFRRQYPRLEDAEKAKIGQLNAQLDGIDAAIGRRMPSISMYRLGPILVCEQGAKLRNLDLDVAGDDAKHWWKTGQVPLRATPVKKEGVAAKQKHKNRTNHKNIRKNPSAVKKNKEKNNKLPNRKDGKLNFFAWLFGLHRRKVWYILPKGKRASGPYCLKELKEKFTGTRVIGGLKIRKGKKGQWISWLNAIETYPLLAYTNISISKKKPKQLNLKHNRSKHSVSHVLKAKTETTNQKKCSQARSEIEGEKEEWFLMKKKQKKSGPYTLKELRAVCEGFAANDGIRIRKGKSGQWVAWVNAGELYPMLPKPRFSAKPSSSISTEHSERNDGKLFTTRFSDHLQRINAIGGPYSSFIGQYILGDVISMLSAAAAEKMALTRLDSKEHSFCFSNAPVSYWICTVPYSIAEAKKWFGKAYGGYSKLLERAWNSDHFRGPGCEVLVHVVFGRTARDAWVNVTIFPVDSQRFGIKPILPIDLLTEAEKNP